MPVQASKSLLDDVNALIEGVTLPSDFAIALMSGRSEMLKAIRRPNGLNAKETEQVAHAFGVLLQTNQALQEHVGRIVAAGNDLNRHLIGLGSKANQINDLANFRIPVESTPDEC